MNAPLLNNVHAFQTRKKEISVYNDIQYYLKSLNNGSGKREKSTSSEYRRDIERFFNVMWGKKLNQLEIKDLDLLPKHIRMYQTHLIDFGFKSNTVNRNINSLRALYSFFEENKYRYIHDGEWIYITTQTFNGIKPIKNNDSNSYGMLYDPEIKKMIELSKTFPNGEEKSLAIELASVTSFRLQAIIDLEWTDFRNENGTWVVRTIDKDKENEKSIRTDLYERLQKIRGNDNKVFHFTSRTMERTIDKLVEMMEIDEDRNIKFHSIKKYGIGEVAMITNGNMQHISDQGNHASYETDKKYYLLFQKDYSQMPCLLIGQEVDLSPIDNLSKEELLHLIKSCDRSTQFKIMNMLKK